MTADQASTTCIVDYAKENLDPDFSSRIGQVNLAENLNGSALRGNPVGNDLEAVLTRRYIGGHVNAGGMNRGAGGNAERRKIECSQVVHRIVINLCQPHDRIVGGGGSVVTVADSL